jgi:hypothetical protein
MREAKGPGLATMKGALACPVIHTAAGDAGQSEAPGTANRKAGSSLMASEYVP